jgi:hypothetical protein
MRREVQTEVSGEDPGKQNAAAGARLGSGKR